uniref:Uncharacterized protein n=1 Tax=Aotus nancymaae TaxID=37293 RepID=A0A2K5C1C5_AOTNA
MLSIKPLATAAFSFMEKEKTKITKSKKPKARRCGAGRPDEMNCSVSLIHVIINWLISVNRNCCTSLLRA